MSLGKSIITSSGKWNNVIQSMYEYIPIHILYTYHTPHTHYTHHTNRQTHHTHTTHTTQTDSTLMHTSHTYTHTHMHTHTHIHTHTYIPTHTHTHKHVCIHIHVHAHTPAEWLSTLRALFRICVSDLFILQAPLMCQCFHKALSNCPEETCSPEPCILILCIFPWCVCLTSTYCLGNGVIVHLSLLTP